MTEVIILMGPSGAGKSTFTRNLPKHRVVSADLYFTRSGEYRFDPRKLGEAHASCMREFIKALSLGESVIVDNTNTTLPEISPYLLVAQALGATKIRVVCVGDGTYDVAALAERNVHGVPLHTIRRQCNNLVKTLKTWPPHFPPVEYF